MYIIWNSWIDKHVLSKDRIQIQFDADIRGDKIVFAKYFVRASVFRPSPIKEGV